MNTNKQRIRELNCNTAIHCKTFEEVVYISVLVNKDINFAKKAYDDCTTNTVIYNYVTYGLYGNLKNAMSNGCTVVQASNYIDYDLSVLRTKEFLDIFTGGACIYNDNKDATMTLLKLIFNSTVHGIFRYYKANHDRDDLCEGTDVQPSNLTVYKATDLIKLTGYTKTMRTINREQFKELYDVACDIWKERLTDWFKELLIKDTVEVSDGQYDRMKRNVTNDEQKAILRKIFGSDDDTIRACDLKIGGMMVADEDRVSVVKGHTYLRTYSEIVDLDNPHSTFHTTFTFTGKRVKAGTKFEIIAK